MDGIGLVGGCGTPSGRGFSGALPGGCVTSFLTTGYHCVLPSGARFGDHRLAVGWYPGSVLVKSVGDASAFQALREVGGEPRAALRLPWAGM